MRPVDLTDIELDQARYAARRDRVRAAAIATKKHRRLPLGDIVTLVFENRETVLFQIQEMAFAEGMTTDQQVQVELDTYNPLLPDSHTLSATLFIEIPDMATLKAELPRLAGLEHALRITVGAETAKAVGEEGRSREDYTSTVHYLRFPLTDGQRDSFRDPSVPASISIDHPAYSDVADINGELRRSLIADLALD